MSAAPLEQRRVRGGGRGLVEGGPPPPAPSGATRRRRTAPASPAWSACAPAWMVRQHQHAGALGAPPAAARGPRRRCARWRAPSRARLPTWAASSGASTCTKTKSWSRQRRHGRAALGRVVGVQVAGGAGHVQHLQAGVDADAADEVDGGDHGAAAARRLAEEPASAAPCPRPRARCRCPAAAAPARSCAPCTDAAQRAAPVPVRQIAAIGSSRMSCGGVQATSSPPRQTSRLR